MTYDPSRFDWHAAKAENDARTFVYFVEGSGLIKIGYARWPENRFASMLTCSPVPLSLLAASPGGVTLEYKLHKQFAAECHHGEWFHKTTALEAVIAAAPLQYGPKYLNCLAGAKGPRPSRSPQHSISQPGPTP